MRMRKNTYEIYVRDAKNKPGFKNKDEQIKTINVVLCRYIAGFVEEKYRRMLLKG